MRATFTLPWPPSVNHLYATVQGRRVLSKKGRQYHLDVNETLLAQGFRRFGDQRVGYCITAFPPDRRRRDLGNLTKSTEDALTKAGLWDDDSQVDDMRVIRGDVTKGGSLFVEVWEIQSKED